MNLAIPIPGPDQVIIYHVPLFHVPDLQCEPWQELDVSGIVIYNERGNAS
jgi:hypothetical protein